MNRKNFHKLPFKSTMLIVGLLLVFMACKNTDKNKEVQKENDKIISFKGDSFKVSGEVKNLDTDVINIQFKDDNGKLIHDSIPVKDDKFSYSHKIEDLTMVNIWPNVDRTLKKAGQGVYPTKSSQFNFIAFPGADVKFSGEIKDYVDSYPSGDKVNKEFAKLNKKLYPLMNESTNLMVDVATEKINDSIELKKAKEKIESLNKKTTQIKKSFIKNNPASLVSSWVLNDMMVRSEVSNESAIDLFKNLDQGELDEYSFYQTAKKRMEGIKATAKGQPAPEINSTNTYDGERFKLSSLMGKYVVLDFWGTWCGPCISGMPRMKEYLDKYGDKLEIVGIAQESDDGTRWKNFLDEHEDYHWHHVLSRKDEDYILKYNVAGFPTKIIIDPEGKIVKRFVGEDDSIYDKLDDILG